MASRETRGAGRLAALIVMTAGYVDGYGLFAYGTFLSFMSGNTTLTGYNLGLGKPKTALPPAIAVFGFLLGAMIGTMLTRARAEPSRRLVLALAAALQASILLATVVHASTWSVGILVVSAAMGMLNRVVTQIGAQPVSLTFVTGTLSRLGDHLARAFAREPLARTAIVGDTHARRAAELAAVWASFLFGALLAGLVVPHLGAWALAPSIAALLVLTITRRGVLQDQE